MPNDTTSPLATYISHLEKGELAYQFSPAANRAVFFPRLLCPFTGSETLEWRVSKGRGTVHATTVVHPAEGAPFNVALVDCDEGFRLMSRVEDISPDAVKITTWPPPSVKSLASQGSSRRLDTITPSGSWARPMRSR